MTSEQDMTPVAQQSGTDPSDVDQSHANPRETRGDPDPAPRDVEARVPPRGSDKEEAKKEAEANESVGEDGAAEEVTSTSEPGGAPNEGGDGARTGGPACGGSG